MDKSFPKLQLFSWFEMNKNKRKVMKIGNTITSILLTENSFKLLTLIKHKCGAIENTVSNLLHTLTTCLQVCNSQAQYFMPNNRLHDC